jgi:hypothetical protein
MIFTFAEAEPGVRATRRTPVVATGDSRMQ